MNNKKYLHEHCNIHPTTVDTLFAYIMQECNAGATVEFRGFGVFKPITRKKKGAHNPKTGKPVMVPEHKTITFKPSPLWIKELNEGRYENHNIKRLKS